MGMPAAQSAMSRLQGGGQPQQGGYNPFQGQGQQSNGPPFAQLLAQVMQQRQMQPQMQRPQQPQPNQGGMAQIIQAMQQRGLFGQQQQGGAQRFMHLGNPQMPQQQLQANVQQMARPMFQRPQAPNPAAGLFGGAQGQAAPAPLPWNPWNPTGAPMESWNTNNRDT